MATAKINGFLFGYRRIKVLEGRLSYALSVLLRADINASVVCEDTVIVRERDFFRTRALLGGRVRYEASDILGIPGIIKRIQNKAGLTVGAVLSALFLLIASETVWDIRVAGNEHVPDSAVTYALSSSGFSIGDFWSRVDRSEVEASVLQKNTYLSWVNINRRGMVAYVTVIEKETTDNGNVTEPTGYGNIVASHDCVIEEITVKRGVAEVKAGDAVKKGDILISGILSDEVGGGFCRAEGTVLGVVSDTLAEDVSREYDKTVSIEKKIDKFGVKIFNFYINIFKIYRNPHIECDIIKEIDGFSLFGRARLPFCTVAEYRFISAVERVSYSDTELVLVASERMRNSLSALLAEGDLLKISTKGDFTDKGYSLRSEIVYSTEVSSYSGFDVIR